MSITLEADTNRDIAQRNYSAAKKAEAQRDELLMALKGFQNAWNENRLLTSDEAAAIRAAIAKAEVR